MSGAPRIASKPSLAPTATRLRQVALVTRDIERTKQLLTHVLGAEVVYEDAAVGQWGLKNFLSMSVHSIITCPAQVQHQLICSPVPLGGDLIEVVAPFQDGTTAGRLLNKRGEGGYMIIMQTEDATRRRRDIETRGLAKVVFEHVNSDVVCVQYHPKGIKGGMMLELDSHSPGANNPTPLKSRFSPWHACGPDHKVYHPRMKRSAHLTLQGCVLRLQPGDNDHEGAARQWEEIFGVARSRDLLAFTNARLGFICGHEGQPEGLTSITVGVNGKDRLDAVTERARAAGVCVDGRIHMCGVQWNLVLTGQNHHAIQPRPGKL
ncbi:hypothetical protein GQ44DRAFT_776447 [Phaeosphaeriaceae sp. PMI808]|nr:hypothetical protein GQ44DRAFT_776447 [Phaeosphaeriaceae sp. PMI808]